MKAYVGQTRSRKMIKRLQELKIGECCCRGELPPRRYPWFYDNGAFRDWKADKPFDVTRFMRDMWRMTTDIENGLMEAPIFIVVPDLVAAGLESLEESESWLQFLAERHTLLYLAVQNGMKSEDVSAVIEHGYGGLFVGGTDDWKMKTMGEWADLAHWHDLKCHVGRISTPGKMELAYGCYIDSIDSSFPLWSEERLELFAAKLKELNDG